MKSFYTQVLKPNENTRSYPNVTRLVKIALTTPVTSVNCERGFSQYNAIKTDTRNTQTVETANILVMLTTEAPD